MQGKIILSGLEPARRSKSKSNLLWKTVLFDKKSFPMTHFEQSLVQWNCTSKGGNLLCLAELFCRM